MVRAFSAVIVVLILLARPVMAQTSADAAAIVDTFPGFSGVVLVAKGGEPVFRQAFGQADREWGVPNAIDGKFRIGSLTKAFTAAAIMQLHEAGKVDIDESVQRFLPETPPAWQPITLRQLMTHTSGLARNLPRMSEIDRKDMALDELMQIVASQPLASTAGEKFAYSNTGYVVLGKVIEVASGQSYASYIADNILKPAGMTASGYDVSASVLPRRVSGYSSSNGRLVNAPFLSMTIPHAAGGLYSTVDDLLLWDQALNDVTLLSEDSRAQIFKRQVPNPSGPEAYGFGWIIGDFIGHRMFHHAGSIPGFASQVSRFPDAGLTVVVLSNVEYAPVGALADNLAAAYLGVPEREPAPGGADILRRYLTAVGKGELNSADLAPSFLATVTPSLRAVEAAVAKLGLIQSIAFLGANASGGDRYRVVFEQAIWDVTVHIDARGKLARLAQSTVPQ